MILVILGVSLIIVIGGVALCCAIDAEDMGTIPFFIGGLGFIISLITTIILIVGVSNLSVIDDKIAMYQEENTRIEEQISVTVSQYQNYETEMFTDLKPESSMTLVSLYPELKSDTLVQAQIEVYTANNQKIKELKEQKINGSVKRWWLYFGK